MCPKSQSTTTYRGAGEPYPQQALVLFGQGVQDTLEDNLLAIYITGSLLMGDFEPASSDIDFLVVTQAPLGRQDAARLGAFHAAIGRAQQPWGSRFEGGYAARAQLRPWGIEGVMAAIEPGEALRVDVPSDYSADNMVALGEHSLTLFGLAPAEVIPPVDRATLDAALREYLAELLARPAATEASPERLADWLLNSARCLFGLRAGRPCTKREAAAWLADEQPELASALATALAARRGAGGADADGVLRTGLVALRRTIRP